MSLFSEMLARFVNSKSIKIYQLANLCGIERSWLQKMLTGKRKPADQEQVMNLSQALALTYTETQQLMNAYRILEMGEENWLRRNSVLKLLKSFRIDENPLQIETPALEFSLSPSCSSQIFHSAAAVNRALHFVLLQESSDPKGFVRIMVQPQFSFLFNCLSVISFDNIPIEHYLCLDSDPKTEIDNLEYIRQIIPLMLNCRGYVPYGYYDHASSLFGSSAFLPNIILTSRYLMRISSDYSEAVISNHPQMLQLCQKYFDSQKKSSWLIFQQTTSFEEYLRVMLMGNPIKASYCIMDHPCVLSFLTPELLQGHLLPSVLSPQMMQDLNHHMANCRDLAMVTHSCFSLNRLKDLYEHGLLTEVPGEYYTPFAQKEIDLLMDIVLQLCDEGTYHMHLVQPSCFDIPPHLCLGALSPQKVTVIFNHPKKGFLAFDVKNLALSSALFDFIEYIQEDETFTLPEETSRKVVQETLEKLRAQQR